MDAFGSHRSLRALPVLCLCRTGFHEFPVGRATARVGIPGHIPHDWIKGSRLALPLAGLPLSVSGGHRQVAVRRPDVAQPDRSRVSLLDATAADTSRLVCRAAAELAP